MATKKTATQKVMTKEELKEKMTAEKATKTTAKKKPVEKALKVTKKATNKKAESQVEKPKAEEAKAEKPKKQVAKTTAKKPATKKPELKESPLNKFFPASVEVEGIAFERHEEVKDWETFKHFTEAMQNAGNHVVLACNWPKKFKKQYDDNSQGDKLFPKDGFEYDLDFNEVLMLQQTREVVITVSILTEQVIIFKDEDFQMTDFDYFLCNGMPFMVYTYTDAE